MPIRITHDGNAITAIFFGAQQAGISCIFGIGVETDGVGSYPAGSYTLTVIWSYFGAAGEVESQTLGVIPFTVSGAVPPPAAIGAPTLDLAGLATLLIALAGFAGWSLRRKSR